MAGLGLYWEPICVERSTFVPGIEHTPLRGQLQELQGASVVVQRFGAVADAQGHDAGRKVLCGDALQYLKVICGDNFGGLEVMTYSVILDTAHATVDRQ